MEQQSTSRTKDKEPASPNPAQLRGMKMVSVLIVCVVALLCRLSYWVSLGNSMFVVVSIIAAPLASRLNAGRLGLVRIV